MDKGSETGILATMHSYLRSKHKDLEDPTDSVLYGPSTENKIERWWRELLDRMERFFKNQLKQLLEDGSYERDNKMHRQVLCFFYYLV